MVILVYAVKEKDDGYAFSSVVEMVAPVEEPICIGRIIIAPVVSYIQIRLVDCVDQLTKLTAHHCRANQVNLIWTSQLSISLICIVSPLTSSNHVDVDLSDDAIQRNCRIFREISVSYTHLRAHETPEHLVCR